MEEIKIIDPFSDSRWDNFVENHPFGWIVHLSGWKKVIEQSFPHIKGYYLVLLEKDTNIIKAGLPIYEIRSWLTGNRLVSIPFATLCNPLVSTEQQGELLIAEAIRLHVQLKFSYFEIRTLNNNLLRDIKALKMNSDYKNHYIDLSQGEELIWKDIKNKTIGRWIKKASKHNIKLKVAQNNLDFLEFYKLYAKTRKRLGLPAQPYSFFKAIFDIFSPSKSVEITLAVLEDKTIASHLCFRFNHRVSVEAVGDDEAYRDIGINHYLYWQEIRQACAEGYKTFDFGRTSKYNPTLMDFKQRWGTTEADLCMHYYNRGQKEVGASNNETSTSYKLMRYLFRSTPGWLQPVLSGFCYRHLG
jgi:FemAB-related protein (PEP-CTERM system-associated)